MLFVYGLAGWVAAVSFTGSQGLLSWDWVGLAQYQRLWADDNWWRALGNLLRYGPIVVGVPMVLGCLLAVLLDQKVRFEGGVRTLYLYPLALSWIVSGTIWRWLLSPDTGIEAWLHGVGFPNAVFDWIVQPKQSLYALALVAVWHGTGFVMAMFIAGLRSVDDAVFKAAMIDGASLPRIYRRIVLPTLRPTVFSAALILLTAALRTFDLVVVLTHGGPGQSYAGGGLQHAGAGRQGAVLATGHKVGIALLGAVVELGNVRIHAHRHRALGQAEGHLRVLVHQHLGQRQLGRRPLAMLEEHEGVGVEDMAVATDLEGVSGAGDTSLQLLAGMMADGVINLMPLAGRAGRPGWAWRMTGRGSTAASSAPMTTCPMSASTTPRPPLTRCNTSSTAATAASRWSMAMSACCTPASAGWATRPRCSGPACRWRPACR